MESPECPGSDYAGTQGDSRRFRIRTPRRQCRTTTQGKPNSRQVAPITIDLDQYWDSFHSWLPSGMAGAGCGRQFSTVDHSVIRGLVTTLLHFVAELPLSNGAGGPAMQPVSHKANEGSPHQPSAPSIRHANSGLFVLCLVSESQPTARQPWVWPDTSQAMVQMKPAIFRSTAVVTWQEGLPAWNRRRYRA